MKPVMFLSAYLEAHELIFAFFRNISVCGLLLLRHTLTLHKGIVVLEGETQCVLFLFRCCEKVNHFSSTH